MKKLELGHIIYNVTNLEKSVKEWQEKGFTVEYGKSKKPYNALIYFKEGPYIELLQSDICVPKFYKFFLSLFGMKQFLKRVQRWETSKEGLMDLCLETDAASFDELTKYLNDNKLNVNKMSWKRIDAQDRKIHFTCFFPNNANMPFFSGQLDERLRNVTHKNNVFKVSSITLNTDAKTINILKDVVNTNALTLAQGDGLSDIKFEYT